MFKKISVEHLRLGMYIHALCSPWLSHPFWCDSFLLTSPHDLKNLRTCETEVWIDTSRGLDIRENIHHAVYVVTDSEPLATHPLEAISGRTPLAIELQRATALCQQAHAAVVDMFQEARMGLAINTHRASQLVQEITRSVARNPNALISVARLKTADTYTYMHSVAVSALMVALARRLGLSDVWIEQAGMAGLLHDIGKAHTRTEVLNKPGALTHEEFVHIQQHPADAHRLLLNSGLSKRILDAVRHHHERLDGRGYPDRLAAGDIQRMARMTAICDIYDAVTSNRPYKQGWDPAMALQRMADWCGEHLDRRLFEAFVKTVGIYPIGSLVRLESNLLGLVCEPSGNSMFTPRVVCFYDVPSQQLLSPPTLIDLAQVSDDRIVAREDPANWPFTNMDALWQKAIQLSEESAAA